MTLLEKGVKIAQIFEKKDFIDYVVGDYLNLDKIAAASTNNGDIKNSIEKIISAEAGIKRKFTITLLSLGVLYHNIDFIVKKIVEHNVKEDQIDNWLNSTAGSLFKVVVY